MLAFDKLINNIALFDDSDYVAVLSDKVDCGLYKNGAFISAETGTGSDLSKLLELRIFNEKAEYRAFRDNLGETKFFERIASDADPKYAIRFDELHYLDIDAKRTAKCEEENALVTTGGGKFFLFDKCSKRKVLVRTYLKRSERNTATSVNAEKYDSHGIEYAFDWRIVGYKDAGFTLPGKE